ncbi:conjugal transfer protein TraO [Aquimarina sp. 2201CG14-23]|uniref:conjugal transfer protein TraO n=1 Tax=Aquimarina mycalae TaxID=3040073 RepID=UPI002477ECBC|nr:conjugal transfer protein TraO [Aquimarina sp. 2201CG14-23]MDH7445905.1 conjugal transfer protein TraO [Aquimarina sp. 2201CG14-23]
MKKLLINKSLLIAFILFSSISMYAQSHKIALSLTGGYVDGGFGGMTTLDYKVNKFDFLQFNIQANFTNLEYEDIKIPVDLYGFNAGFFFDLLRNNNRKFALSIGAGGTIGYETINNGDEVLENNQVLDIETSSVVFGAYAGIEADIFLIPTVAINIRANEIYHINSEIGEFTPYFGLGIKLILK